MLLLGRLGTVVLLVAKPSAVASVAFVDASQSTVELGYNAFPPITLFSLGPLGKAHKSNVFFSRIFRSPDINAFPLLTLLSLAPLDKIPEITLCPA